MEGSNAVSADEGSVGWGWGSILARMHTHSGGVADRAHREGGTLQVWLEQAMVFAGDIVG